MTLPGAVSPGGRPAAAEPRRGARHVRGGAPGVHLPWGGGHRDAYTGGRREGEGVGADE